MKLTAAQVAEYAAGAFAPADQVDAVAVALAEHAGHVDTAALGDTSLTNATWGPSVGIWQIRSLTPAALAKETNPVDRLRVQAKLVDPVYNASTAAAIHRQSGWTPWSTYPGVYLLYLPTARAAVKTPAAVGASSATAAGSSPGNTASVIPAAYQPVGLGSDLTGAAGLMVLPLGLLNPSNMLGAAKNAVGLLGALVAFLTKAAAWLGNRANWMRIVKVVLGWWMVLIGLLMFGWPALNAAADVIPAGKAAKAAGSVKASAGKVKSAGAAARTANQGV